MPHFTPSLLAAMLTIIMLATPAHTEARLSIEDVIERVLKSHPDIEEIAQREKALEQNTLIAKVWPDARFSAEYSNMPLLKPYPGAHPMSGVQLKVSQTFPFFGKIKARRDAALTLLKSSAPERQEVRNQVAGHIYGRLVQWQLSRALQDITTQHIQSLTELIGAIRARYELGRAEQYELIRASVLRDKLRDDLQGLQKRCDAQAAAIAALAPQTQAADIKLDNVKTIKSKETSLETLLAEAQQKRPLFLVFETLVKSERAKAAVFELGALPDITSWVGYRVRLPSDIDAGDNFFSVGFSLPLAWSSRSNKWNASAQQNRAKANAIVAKSQSLTLAIRERLSELLIERERAEQRHQTYRDVLLPGAAKTLSATLGAYQVDRAGFAELFSAELTTFEFERAALNILADKARIDVEINTLVGRYAAPISNEPASPLRSSP